MRYNSALILLPALVVISIAVSPTASLVQIPYWNDSSSSNHHQPRRSFLQKSVGALLTSGASSAVLVGASSILVVSKSPPAHAATTESLTGIVTQTVKVTPVAHTFVSSTPSSSNGNKASLIKPLRENDATRYFTNAKVVHLFYDGDADQAMQTAKDILQLTVQRKAGQGPGVTPGKVHLLVNGLEDESTYSNIPGLELLKSPSLKFALTNLPVGDVVFLPPKKSNGTIINGMLVEQSALTSGLEVGGTKSGGVISCLINGPKEPESIAVLDGGYTTSTILWYGP
jgi:hypothetical protein